MPTLFIVIGTAKVKAGSDDKIIRIDFKKYGFGDIPKLLALAKIVGSGKIDKDALSVLGVKDLKELEGYDKVKICLEQKLEKIVEDKVKPTIKDGVNIIFSCE